MEDPYYRLSNPEFLPWLTNLIAVIVEHKGDLPITDEQIARLVARRDSHQVKMNRQVAAEEAATAATRDMNDDRAESNREIGFFNTIFKANKTIPLELRLAMGFKVSESRTSPDPNTPLEMTVRTFTDGRNLLKWQRNGNKTNTIFVVEMKIGDDGEWVYLTSTTKTSFTHTDRKLGEQIAYRVRATRNKKQSAWCIPAFAYFKG